MADSSNNDGTSDTYQYSEIANRGQTYIQVLQQQDDILYYLNDPTDSSGYVLELGSLDVSGQLSIDPSFATLLTESLSYTLGECQAVLEFDVSLSKFQGMFSIQTDSSDVNDLSASDVQFRVNQPSDDTYNDISNILNVGTLFEDISYSEAVAKYGRVNNYYSNQQVKYDFVRHLAKSITGGYSSSDIFSNEQQLVDAVSALDTQIGNTFNGVISDMSGVGWQPSSYVGNHAAMIHAAYRLYNLNLQTTYAAEAGNRSYDLLNDISNASANKVAGVSPVNVGPMNIPIRFYAGDRIAVRLNYVPASATFSGNGASIVGRAYKVMFRLV